MKKIIYTSILFLFCGNVFPQVSNPTHLTSAGESTNSASITTEAVTPPGNTLVVVVSAFSNNASRTFSSVTDTWSGSSVWTIIGQFGDAAQNNRVMMAWATVGSSPGSGTVTVNISASVGRRVLIVSTFTGADTNNPIIQTETGLSVTSTLSVTMASPGANNIFYGGIYSRDDSDGITPGTNETELAEASSGGTNEARAQTQYGTDTTHNWSDLASVDNLGIVAEIQEVQAGRRVIRSFF